MIYYVITKAKPKYKGKEYLSHIENTLPKAISSAKQFNKKFNIDVWVASVAKTKANMPLKDWKLNKFAIKHFRRWKR